MWHQATWERLGCGLMGKEARLWGGQRVPAWLSFPAVPLGALSSSSLTGRVEDRAGMSPLSPTRINVSCSNQFTFRVLVLLHIIVVYTSFPLTTLYCFEIM